MDSDPLSGDIVFQLLLLVFLTAVNAFFSGAEMAVVSVNKNKIHRLAEQGDRRAALIQQLLKDSTVSVSYTHLLATERMVAQAVSLRADAIVAARYNSSSVAQGAAEVMAYGTAVRFV